MVLPKAEWERIQDNLDSTTREAARILAEKKEREEMHLRSKAAVKDWPNTIMGLAQRKLKAKKLREEREEEERKLLDLEEQRFQAAKRKEALDHAKTYLYYQNERVKGLHSALLLAEVLKERDAQVEFKKLKSDVNKKKGEEKEHEHKEAILREEEKAHQCYMNQQALRRDQLEQIKEHKHQADLAKLEDKREGEQIQRLNRLYQLEIQRGKEKEQEEKVERQRLHHEYVAEQKIIKAEEKQKEDEDDDRIKAYIKGKEMMADLTREKDAETNRLTQVHKDKAFAQLTAQMNEACKIEDDRLARGAAEVEYEYQMKNKEKEAKEKAAIKSIAEHRATVMKMKVEKEREEKAEDEKDRNQWMTADRIYLETEKAKKQRQRDANMEVQKIQIQQMVNRRAVSPFSKKHASKPIVLDLLGGRERERNLAVGVMCAFCLFVCCFNLCALQVLRLGTSLFSEQWSRSLFQADLAHAGWGGLPGRAGNK
uniref:Trichohyalin-plectin-homology domain-containing protein n=1 Tax=Aquila chrysaetos chrysaetos TaxID=223781 RepID=A0A663ENK9_AQUCH